MGAAARGAPNTLVERLGGAADCEDLYSCASQRVRARMDVRDSLLRPQSGHGGSFRRAAAMAALGAGISLALVAVGPAAAHGVSPDPSPPPGQPTPDPYPPSTPPLSATAPATKPVAPAVRDTPMAPTPTPTPTARDATVRKGRKTRHARPHRSARALRTAAQPSVEELKGVIDDLWSLRRLPPAAAAELTAANPVPVWAALALAAVVLASGMLVLRVGRETSA